jgi:hypothetical protein
VNADRAELVKITSRVIDMLVEVRRRRIGGKNLQDSDQYSQRMGPSGREVISLQKVDSLLVSLNIREAKKVSVTQCWRDLDKNSFVSNG